MAGSLSTLCEAEITFKVPELNVTVHISTPFYVTTKKSNCDIIFGRDLLWHLDILLDFQNNFVG